MQRPVCIALAADGSQTLQRHLGLQRGRIDTIAGQLFGVDGDGDLFRLLTHDTQFSHFGNGT